MHEDIKNFFLEPKTPKQKQYEALRAYIVEGLSAKEVSKRFDFSESSIYALAHSFRAGKLDFFSKSATGPKDRRVNQYVRDLVCELRKNNFSTTDIVFRLRKQNVNISQSTAERILKDAGFGKLPRRTGAQRGISVYNSLLSKPAQNIDFNSLEPFRTECQVAGIFFFLPYIIESGIINILKNLPLPESGRIGRVQAGLSFLLLKLIGGKRLSHIRQYDHDPGFGIFAGLNILPKPTYMLTYSCLISAETCLKFEKEIIGCFTNKYPDFYNGETINLDFHSIPHFGDKSEMEKVWCGARNKALKGANTFFAQDAETRSIIYANADVLRKEGRNEVKNFVNYLKEIKGVFDQTLVFDSRLTTYKTLGDLDDEGIKFITLRKRNKKLLEETQAIADSKWQNVKLPIPKRKYQKFWAYENEVILRGCNKSFRQIIMKDHGRVSPTFVITNNFEMKLADILTIYSRRWRIENKLAELVDFFNINALSSPIMVRIHFDLMLSIIASFMYQLLAKDLQRFEKHLAPDIFRRFINMPGIIKFDGESFEIQIRKRAHTPILMGVEKLNKNIHVPWMENKNIKIVWKG